MGISALAEVFRGVTADLFRFQVLTTQSLTDLLTRLRQLATAAIYT